MKTLFGIILFAGVAILVAGFFVKPIEDSVPTHVENEVVVHTAVDSSTPEKTSVEMQPEPESADPFYWNTLTSAVVPESIPFSTYLQTILEKNRVSMIGDSDGEQWWITVLNEEILPGDRYQQRRIGNAPYGSQYLAISILETDRFYANIADDQRARVAGNRTHLSMPGEIGEVILFDTTWNWFDFDDAYDGGFMRSYFREENGYVLLFRLSDEVVTSNPDISEVQSVQFLKVEE